MATGGFGSVFFIALALPHVAIYGPGVEANEGTEAHLFQSWLALGVLALQLAAGAGVIALVYWFEHA